jgi:hypothetical protein
MFSGALIVIGLFGVTTQLFEIFVSERRKAAITDGLTHVWDWLDEMRKPSFAQWVQRPWPRRILVGLSTLLGLWASYSLLQAQLTPSPAYPWTLREALLALLSNFVGVGVGLWIVRRITKAPSYTQPVILLGILGFATILQLLGASIFSHPNVPEPDRVSPAPDFPLFLVIAIPFCTVIFLMWFVVAAPMTLALLAAGALALLEFFVRRIIEYPKGPVIALGTIFTATGTFLKWVAS